MCEANAYLIRNGKEELILEAVDIVEPAEGGKIRMANIFGEQKVIAANPQDEARYRLAATLLPRADLRQTITILVMVLMVLAIIAVLEAPLRRET